MRASHELSRVEVSFDDPNLVSHARLLQAASLWQRLGMPGVVARGLRTTAITARSSMNGQPITETTDQSTG